MYDENGKRLTTQDLDNHNFTKIYNADGVEGTVNADGSITFKDQSTYASSYVDTAGNAILHSAAKTMATGKSGILARGAVKGAAKMTKRGGLINRAAGGAGVALFKPATAGERAGLAARSFTDKAVEKVSNNMLDKAIASGAGDEMLERILHGDGSKTTDVIQRISGTSDKGVIAKAKKGAANIKTKAKSVTDKVKNVFSKGGKEVAEETVEKAAQLYMLTAHMPHVNTILDTELKAVADAFGLEYRKDFLNL